MKLETRILKKLFTSFEMVGYNREQVCAALYDYYNGLMIEGETLIIFII